MLISLRILRERNNSDLVLGPLESDTIVFQTVGVTHHFLFCIGIGLTVPAVALISPDAFTEEQVLVVYPRSRAYRPTLFRSRPRHIFIVKSFDKLYRSFNIGVVQISRHLAVLQRYKRHARGQHKVCLNAPAVIEVSGSVLGSALLPFSSYIEESVPIPFALLEQFLRILRVDLRDSALLIPHKRAESYLPERAVILAVDLILIHKLLSALPLGKAQIEQLVDRLVSVHNDTDREVRALKREHIGRHIRLNIRLKLCVTVYISHILPLEDIARRVGIVSVFGNTVNGLEKFARGSSLLNIVPRKPLDTLINLHIGILKLILYLTDSLLNVGVNVFLSRRCENGACRRAGA